MSVRKKGISRLNKKISIVLIAIIAFLAGTAAGFFIPKIFLDEKYYVPSLSVTGDVFNDLKIREPGILKERENISYGDRRFKAMRLEDILALAEPAGNEYSIYLIADDGRTAKLAGDQLEGSYIAFGDQNGWEAINYNHPASTNIKEIREIIVVVEDRERDLDFGLNIIDMNRNIASITPGEVRLAASSYLEYGGTSYKDVGDKKYESSTFEAKHIFKLESFLESGAAEKMILMGAMGEYSFVDNTGYFELDGNVFNYIDPVMNEKLEDLAGIVLEPGPSSIMDVYYDATGFINSGSNVMLIITDGFGYHQYEHAAANGYLPFLASKEGAKKALSMYKPVSNTGLAAMFTGKSPGENGIYSREQRELSVPTIFGELGAAGKRSVLLEGDIQIIKTEIEATLHTDKNANGTSDDEILEAALKNIGSGYSFIAVHFHSIDDAGHDFGDISRQTMEQARLIDSYIKQLAGSWDGKMIITSDHGMHPAGEGGGHGQFRFEDMVVPYIVIDGGL